MSEDKTNEYILTAHVISRAIQMASSINARLDAGQPRVEPISQIENAVNELKAIHPQVMKLLNNHQ